MSRAAAPAPAPSSDTPPAPNTRHAAPSSALSPWSAPSSPHTPSSTDTHAARPGGPVGLAARVTAQLLAALNNGVRPWVQPWDSAAALALPLRYNGVPYKGFNIIALWAAAAEHQFTSRYWLTFKQAHALGGQVRRGERATHILFYKDLTPASSAAAPSSATSSGTAASSANTDTPARRVVLRSFAVFSANQIDGLPAHFLAPPPPPPDTGLTARLDPAFDRVPAFLTHGGARACYNPTTDTIHLPPRHSFISDAQYFSTRLHESAHWSGHPTRLARDAFVGPRTAAVYAREELVAELCAAFLGAELGLPVDHVEEHASYLDHWLKILDRDPGALLAAAAHAQRAADFLRPLLGLTPAAADTIVPDTTDTPEPLHIAARLR